MAQPGVASVTLFDGGAGTPTLAQLQQFQIVVAYLDAPFADAAAMGNVVADYIDGNGVFVGTTFLWGQFSPVQGRYATGGYSPFNIPDTNVFTPRSLGTFNAGHPLMQGVTALNADDSNDAVLASGATQIAAWNTGNPLIAVKTQSGHTSVGITAYLGDFATHSGNFALVIANAGRWLGASPCGTPTPTPTPTCTPGVTLYGISNGFGTAEDNEIYQIDPATGTISNTHQVTLAGFTVSKSQAMAARPSDGVLFAVIETTEPARRLVTINPNTGVATSIGVLTNNISSLAFRSTGTLWAVSGDGGSPAETLYTVNTSNATLTLQFALGNGADGETIAFHGNGLMYHSSGNASAMFESVNVDTQVVTPIGTAVGEMFAMGYNPTNGQLYGSDISSDLFTINIATERGR